MSNFESYLTNPLYIKSYGFNGKGVVYVENEADIHFWKSIIDHYHPGEYEVKASVKFSHVRGKMALKKYYNTLSRAVLVAVDADFDFIASNQSDDAKQFKDNPYLLHTFVYSRESILCNSITLNNVTKKIGYSKYLDYDFSTPLTVFSNIIFDCLIRALYLLDKRLIDNHEIIHNIFRKNFNLSDSNDKSDAVKWLVTPNELQDLLNELSEKIHDEDDFNSFRSEAEKIGLTKDSSFRFISGHDLKDKIIDVIMQEKMTELNSFEKERIISECKENQQLRKDRLNEYRNHIKNNCSFNTLLLNCESVNDDPIYKLIKNKVKAIA